MDEDDRQYLLNAARRRGKTPAQLTAYQRFLERASVKADHQISCLDFVSPHRHILYSGCNSRPWHAHYHKFARPLDRGYFTLCPQCAVVHCACHCYAVDSPNVALTYDDWGEGPQCTQCGLTKKC